MSAEVDTVDIIEETINNKAISLYPINIARDVDGDTYDNNKFKRESFIEGCLFGIKLHQIIILCQKK